MSLAPLRPQTVLCAVARRAVLSMALSIGRLGLVGLAGLAGPASPAQAQAPPERERIAAERREVEATFNAAQTACQSRFLLTQCLDQAREQRRLAMDSLQRRQLEIDDLARRERSAQRLQALQQRAAAGVTGAGTAALTAVLTASGAVAAPMAAPASGREPGLAAQSQPASAPVRLITGPRTRTEPESRSATKPAAARPALGAAAAASAAQRAQRSQADFQRRQHEADAHRAAVLARNQRQDADRPPAAGLPVPAAPKTAASTAASAAP